MKSGFVSIIGRPNVGKSTLINSLVGEKIAITSDKPSTTRNLIQGVYTKEDLQIVFVDTPGIHKPVHRLGNKLNSQAYYSANDVDVILLVMDAKEKLGKGDNFVLEKIKTVLKPVILVLNKIDKLTNEEIMNKINETKDLYNFAQIVPVSAKDNDNIDRLIKVVSEYLTDSVKYFPDDIVSSSTLEFRICEIVREKILELTKDEIPHSVTCILSDISLDEKSANIYIDIIVDRDSIKKIIIGKKGSMLKEIGTKARIEIQELLKKAVYLELYVKTLKKWRDKEKYLSELGFNDF